ncbi:MAG: ribonuclease P protein component [Candidatus Moraniibacteriota bacterium]|nr:MAG: ribonuclease P protein component [Candidatus Moranbacteria bacterium]
MLGTHNRLRDNNELLYVLKKGKRHYSGGVLLYWIDNNIPYVRCGFIVGKKFSPLAVKRNKQKRILRSAVKNILPKIAPGKDIVISYINHGKILSYAESKKVILHALKKNNLIIK